MAGEINSCLQCFHHSSFLGKHHCTVSPQLVNIKDEYGNVDMSVWNCENWESNDDDLWEESE
jgi:hypothetical protein